LGSGVGPAEALVPTFSIRGDWKDLFKKDVRPAIEGVLLRYIRGRRWFGGKARKIQSYAIWDIVPMPFASTVGHMALVRVEYSEGEPEVYVLPMAFASGEEANALVGDSPGTVIARVTARGREGITEGVIYDALADAGFCNGLLSAIRGRRHFRGTASEVAGQPTRAFRRIRGQADGSLQPSLLKAEQSNTSVVYGDRLVLKVFRRLGEGVNPDWEVGRYLTEKAAFPHTAPVAGAIEYRRRRGEPMTLGVLHGYVQNEGDAWKYTLDSIGHYFECVLAQPNVSAPTVPATSLVDLQAEEPPATVCEAIGSYLASARLLGERTAELHLALASATDDPALAREPFTAGYQRSVYHQMRSLTVSVLPLLRRRIRNIPEEAREDAEKVLALENAIISSFGEALRRKTAALRIRCHGDYHLGQVLYTGKDFVIIDFEGEPARPLGERRLKRSPLRDVAGMIRSFDYAVHAALLGQASTVIRPDDVPLLTEWGQVWYSWVASNFLGSYLGRVAPARLLPDDPEQVSSLLDAFVLAKAVYEVGYELDNRPDWVRVPLRGILQLMGSRT
ncbi:MAG: putative maltokinase, partial [Chloroflexota bacterium]|nr:putative maltokinase [Chloroflexota bacterium]